MRRHIAISFALLVAAQSAIGQDLGKGPDPGGLDVLGGPVALVIATASPGDAPLPTTDNGTRLRWKPAAGMSKITVTTLSPGQRFSLSVTATGVKQGLSAGTVVLMDGMFDQDLIVDLDDAHMGSAHLTYTAWATVNDGNSVDQGADAHIITYTLTAQ